MKVGSKMTPPGTLNGDSVAALTLFQYFTKALTGLAF